MSSLLRGEIVKLCQIYFQSEVAYSCVAQLGELGVVQFRDLNPQVNAFQKKYVNEVRRCEEMERKIRFIEKELVKEVEIDLNEPEETADAPKQKDMLSLESTLNQLEHDLLEVNSNKDALKKNYLELIELRHILTKAAHFFEEQNMSFEQTAISMEGPAVDPRGQSLRLGFIAGILNRDKVPSFELMLWRMCRGNVFLKTAEVGELTEDPLSGQVEAKTVFIIFFQGEQLKLKCKKICDALKATIYPCPETQVERKEMLTGVTSRLDELSTVLDQSLNLRKSLLMNASKNLNTWHCKVKKMKAIFHTMNMFKIDQKSIIAECWIPQSEMIKIKDVLDKETKKIDRNFQTILNYLDTNEQPPTYHKVNKVTVGFQSLVNAYGVPGYQEINPAIFTTITFPFLFAVMFGDAGHGLLVFLISFFMVRRENSLKKSIKGNEIMEIFFGGRYIVLLMSVFSIYTGFIYNDFFSKCANIFGSSWRVGVGKDFDFEKVTQFILDPNPNSTEKMYSGNPYPFGLDPVWQFGTNKITFTNGLKMKFSIIIGVMQMTFGLILGLFNHLHFRKWRSIFFEFIPQIIFLSLLFIYLCILIISKWIMFAGTNNDERGSCAPSLLLEFINMFFLKNNALKTVIDKDGTIHEITDKCKVIYPGQYTVQSIFVVLSVLCIPVMLLVKPILAYCDNKKKSKYGVRFNNDQEIKHKKDDNIEENGNSSSSVVNFEEEEEEKFDFGEMFVEQTIHTIEYFLGCISHTASYLRLWALSLAHAELSEVIWTMTLSIGIKTDSSIAGPLITMFTFMFWGGGTLAVLCGMEGLSAFLHALRLHWVEFQSKFYKGDGYEFTPFSFEQILNDSQF